MAYYRSTSPIIGYSGHIPGEKWHVGSRIRTTANSHNLSDALNNKLIINNTNSHHNPPIRERTEDTTTTETGSTITNGSHSYDWEGNPVRKNRSLSRKKIHNKNIYFNNNNINNDPMTKLQQSKSYNYNIGFEELENQLSIASQQQQQKQKHINLDIYKQQEILQKQNELSLVSNQQQLNQIKHNNLDSLKQINYEPYKNNKIFSKNFSQLTTPYPLQSIGMPKPNIIKSSNINNFEIDSQQNNFQKKYDNNLEFKNTLQNNYQTIKNYEPDNDDKTELNVNDEIKEETNLLVENKCFEELETPTHSPSNEIIKNEFIESESSMTSNESVNDYDKETVQSDCLTVLSRNSTNNKFNEPESTINVNNNKLIKKINNNDKQSIFRQGSGVSQYHRNCCRQTKQKQNKDVDEFSEQSGTYVERNSWTEGQALKNLRAYKCSIGMSNDNNTNQNEDKNKEEYKSESESECNQNVPIPGYSGHIPEIYSLSIGKSFTKAAKESFKLHHTSYQNNSNNFDKFNNSKNLNNNNQLKIFKKLENEFQQRFTSIRRASREINTFNQRSPY